MQLEFADALLDVDFGDPNSLSRDSCRRVTTRIDKRPTLSRKPLIEAVVAGARKRTHLREVRIT
jgi:hypothetical protein